MNARLPSDKSSANRPPRRKQSADYDDIRDSLKARRCAAIAVQNVIRNDEALEQALSAQADYQVLRPRDRAFARAIAATTFRRYAQIQAALKPFIRKAPPPFVMAVLETASAQILFLKTPAHAAVGESVEVLKSRSSARPFANMANAILRNIVKSGPKLAGEVAPSANIPGWMRSSWEKAYGKAELRKMAARLMQDPVLDLQIKSLADDTSLKDWAQRLEGTALGTSTVRLESIGDITQLDGFEQGQWWAQDIAASLPVQIANILSGGLSGKRVLDVCAAPGGKTMQLAAKGAHVSAMDRSEKRLVRLAENLKRAQLSADIICSDALEWADDEKNIGRFDVVILDAPCSATGTFRRHPDVLYNKTPKSVSDLTKLQDKLLKKASSWLKPDGLLIYAVCSLQPEEAEPRINRFLGDMSEFRLISIPQSIGVSLPEARFKGGMLRSLPSDLPEYGGMDGFFIAALGRK